jgi:twinkle protein
MHHESLSLEYLNQLPAYLEEEEPAPKAPFALNMNEVFEQAVTELAKPFPAIPLNGWPIWTAMTGGFRMREFTIFCGPTGAGKTTFLANISAHLLKQKTKHFVMSVETGHTDFMKRILSALAGKDLNTGEVVPAPELIRICDNHQEILTAGTIEFSLYEDRVPIHQLKKDLLYMVKEKGCKIAMIDNLNFFMEVKRASDQLIEMDRVIHELIIFCKQVDVHVIMVMHPKKTDGSRIESEFDIKGSSTAVQEAHNVFLFNRPKPTDGRNPSERDLTLKKMRRRGSHVGKTIVFSNHGTQYVEKGYA